MIKYGTINALVIKMGSLQFQLNRFITSKYKNSININRNIHVLQETKHTKRISSHMIYLTMPLHYTEAETKIIANLLAEDFLKFIFISSNWG